MSEFSLKDLILEAKNIKQAFVPAMPKEAGAMPPMDPAMMQGGGMPPAAPMDPSMMGGAPMDPSMAGGAMPPMDPAMMPPPPPPAEGGAAPVPPSEQDPNADLQEVMQVVSQMAEGMDKIESKQEALEQKYQDTMSQFDEMRGKIDMLINILEGKKSGI